MITLKSTKQAFDIWRANKININTPISAELWSMVNQLLSTHKKSELRKALGITNNQIQLHCTTSQTKQSQVKTPLQPIGDFVEATPPSLNAGMAEMTLKGESKSLHLCLPASTLCEVLPMLGALL